MTASPRHRPDEARRGWCPGLARPMPTGDGLLARVHPPLGILSLDQLRAVAAASRRFGNGHVDVTSRANLQIRGVAVRTTRALAASLTTSGLGDVRADGGPQRLTLTSPLTGLAPGEAIDVSALARTIEAEGVAIGGLPAKTLVAIEGPGVGAGGADIVLRPEAGGRVTITLASDHGEELVVSERHAAAAVAAILRAFTTTGRLRMRELSSNERRQLLEAAEGALDAAEVPSPDRERGPARAREASRLAVGPSPGVAQIGSVAVLCVEAPFGRCDADALDRLADIALAISAPEIRFTPTRGFVLARARREAAAAALDDLTAAGFITHPDDPRRAVAACPGAPACASGTTPVPDHAMRLATVFAPFARRGLRAHVSGCAKGCAHPAPADLTFVAENGRYAVLVDAAPDGRSAMRLTFEAALERVRRADPAAPLAEAFRT